MMAGMGGAPHTRAVADAFLTDRLGRVLLTLPTFRPDWVPPGGDVDAGEDPKVACEREVFEELGLVVTARRLLLLDRLPPHRFRPWPAVYFLFDCGEVTTGSRIRRNADEVRAHAFVDLERVAALTNAATARRLAAAATAKSAGITVNMPSVK
jgi:8-oxo-dGTP diphosphatase